MHSIDIHETLFDVIDFIEEHVSLLNSEIFKFVTLSAIMCRKLTNRLTKHVSFSAFVIVLLCLSLNVFAQKPVDETGNPNGKRLEEIDEADVSYSVSYKDNKAELTEKRKEETATPLSEEVEDLKKAALELNRDLLILEEELLFPANSQVVVFLSLDVGQFFSLDSVKVLIDDEMVASHLYTKRQNTALSLGGIQRLYLGNLKSGDHEVTAFFVGVGPDNREYKRGATVVIKKEDDPKLLELKIRDSTLNMQPEFEFEEWQL